MLEGSAQDYIMPWSVLASIFLLFTILILFKTILFVGPHQPKAELVNLFYEVNISMYLSIYLVPFRRTKTIKELLQEQTGKKEQGTSTTL